jgi:mono/diheme cytochrome c family protein
MVSYRTVVALSAALVAVPAFVDQAVPAFVDQRDHGEASGDAISRGKYLVEGVGHCWTCHTPRDSRDQPDRQRWLLGGPVPFQPARPTESWAEVAPRLAGIPPGTDAEFVRLMTTGLARTGRPPRAPMPQFRLTQSDAESVLAYLKSLTTAE